MTKPNISAVIDPDLKFKVKKLLKKNELTETWLINKAYTDYLRKNG